MADPQYVQGGIFGGLTFAPLDSNPTFGATPGKTASPDSGAGLSLDWSTIPDYLASIPSNFAPSATSPGTVITSRGGTSTGGSVAGNGAPAYTVGSPSNAAAGAQPVAASGVVSGSLADYFLRGVIIILGFIFVAIGLNMFRPGTIVVPGLRK